MGCFESFVFWYGVFFFWSRCLVFFFVVDFVFLVGYQMLDVLLVFVDQGYGEDGDDDDLIICVVYQGGKDWCEIGGEDCCQ